jgi:hypothetical protein
MVELQNAYLGDIQKSNKISGSLPKELNLYVIRIHLKAGFYHRATRTPPGSYS